MDYVTICCVMPAHLFRLLVLQRKILNRSFTLFRMGGERVSKLINFLSFLGWSSLVSTSRKGDSVCAGIAVVSRLPLCSLV